MKASHGTDRPLPFPFRISYEAPGDLVPDKNNPRTHSKRQRKKIGQGIGEFGFLVPIVIGKDRRIIAGHARQQAALELGLSRVPCVDASHLTELQLREFLLFENRISEDAGWSVPKLETFLQGILEIAPDCTFEHTGFEPREIELLLKPRPKAKKQQRQGTQLSLAFQPQVCRPGDVFRLGPHRLVCGDPREPELLALTLGGEQAQMVISDPGLAVADTPAWRGLLAIQQQATCTAAVHCVFADWQQSAALQDAIAHSNFELLDVCVWTGAPARSLGLYRPAHRQVFILKSGPCTPINNLGRRRNRSNLWSEPIDEVGLDPAEQAVAKPVALVAAAIRDFTRRKGLVFDPFGGAGATLWAAEETGRRAVVLQVNPALVDAACRRWRATMPDEAVHEASNSSFSALERDRATQESDLCLGEQR